MNLLGPELVRDLVTLIQRAEADDAVQVLVFRSADPDYFISHVDLTRITKYRAEAAKLTGEASIAMLFRYLSASQLVTIAQIEGRVRAAGDVGDHQTAGAEHLRHHRSGIPGPAGPFLLAAEAALATGG